MTSESIIQLQRWRERLPEFRQPWPQWTRLEQLAAETLFVLESDPDVPFENQFLSGPKEPNGYRIIVAALTPSQEKQFRDFTDATSVFPKYLLALLDLKFSDSVMMAGGIAGNLCPMCTDADVTPPPPLGPEICQTEPHAVAHKAPGDINWPSRPTFPLQTNSSGIGFYVDDQQSIRAFSPSSRSFVRIGSTDDFVRYCLEATLNHQDWYRNYSKHSSLEKFGLTHFDDVGLD